jgi:hypothetical protein
MRHKSILNFGGLNLYKFGLSPGELAQYDFLKKQIIVEISLLVLPAQTIPSVAQF